MNHGRFSAVIPYSQEGVLLLFVVDRFLEGS